MFSTYAISFICAITLLLIKKEEVKPHTDKAENHPENIKSTPNQSEEQEEKEPLGIDNIIIVSIIIVLLIFAMFVLYVVWALNNT